MMVKRGMCNLFHTIRTDSFTTHTPLYDQLTKLPTIPPLKRIDYLRYIPRVLYRIDRVYIGLHGYRSVFKNFYTEKCYIIYIFENKLHSLIIRLYMRYAPMLSAHLKIVALNMRHNFDSVNGTILLVYSLVVY